MTRRLLLWAVLVATLALQAEAVERGVGKTLRRRLTPAKLRFTQVACPSWATITSWACEMNTLSGAAKWMPIRKILHDTLNQKYADFFEEVCEFDKAYTGPFPIEANSLPPKGRKIQVSKGLKLAKTFDIYGINIGSNEYANLFGDIYATFHAVNSPIPNAPRPAVTTVLDNTNLGEIHADDWMVKANNGYCGGDLNNCWAPGCLNKLKGSMYMWLGRIWAQGRNIETFKVALGNCDTTPSSGGTGGAYGIG